MKKKSESKSTKRANLTKNSSKSRISDEEESSSSDEEIDNNDLFNQLLHTSTVTALGRTEQPNFASHVINVSLLSLNEFNAEFEYELSRNSMPAELLESEHKLLKARQKLLEEIEMSSK